MKKFIAILAISCTSLLVSGCFGGEEEVPVDSTYNVQSFVGTVSELSGSSLNATHIMETDAGETVYLRSVLFDLDEFVGSNLRVTGTMEQTDSGENILLVESKDVLELNPLSSEPFLFEFEDKGFDIEIPEDKFEISESASLANFVSEDFSFSVRYIQKGLELDLEIYLDENYGDQVPQSFLSSLGDNYSKLNLGTGRTVYIHNTDDVIYEVIFNSDGSNQASLNVEITNILDNIYFNPEDIALDTTNETQDIDDSELPEDVVENEQEEESQDNQTVVSSEPVDLSSLSSEVSTVVRDINSNKATLLGSDVSINRYSITDNSYVYVSYSDSDGANFRKLLQIDGANFTETAFFEEGTQTDWELVSGNNVAFDRPLKMVFVEEEGYRQIDVKEGYRYFESLPMSLGFHYPRQWYYAGGSKSYDFSNEPLPEGDTLVAIDIVDESFNSINGESVSANIKRQTSGSEISYFVQVRDSEVIKVSGDETYSEELNIMAQTLVEIDK